MKSLLHYWHTAALVLALGLFGVTFTGCETTEGAGRDIQAIGGGVEDAADETRPYD